MKITRKKENAQPAQQVTPTTFAAAPDAGILRSGLDEPEYLPEAFEQLSADFGALLGKWDVGRLSAEAFAEALAKLVVREEDGTEWTIGARSGQWYRKGYDGAWHPTSPPEDVGVTRYVYASPVSAARVMMEEVQVLEPIARVVDVGVPLDVREPHPVVGVTSSGAALPEFRDAGSMIDEHGGWDTSFSAVSEREPVSTWGLDDLIADEAGGDGSFSEPAAPQAPAGDEPQTRVWSLRDELEGMGSEHTPPLVEKPVSSDSSWGSDTTLTTDAWGSSETVRATSEDEPSDDDDDLGLPPELFS